MKSVLETGNWKPNNNPAKLDIGEGDKYTFHQWGVDRAGNYTHLVYIHTDSLEEFNRETAFYRRWDEWLEILEEDAMIEAGLIDPEQGDWEGLEDDS